MKKLFALVATLMFSLSAYAAQFEEGVSYKVLDLPPSSKPSVVEFFSFYCPHCNAFEPIISQLNDHLPEGVKLQKNHVSFMGGRITSYNVCYTKLLRITAVANVGPGMGNIIGPTGNFAPLPDAAKWILSFGMLMGRLEILTIAENIVATMGLRPDRNNFV